MIDVRAIQLANAIFSISSILYGSSMDRRVELSYVENVAVTVAHYGNNLVPFLVSKDFHVCMIHPFTNPETFL